MPRLARNQVDILAALITADRPLAPSEIVTTMGGIHRSSVYTALGALQRSGYVEAEWDLTGAQPRRVFTVTTVGEEALTAAQRESPALRAAVRLQGAG